MTISWHHDHPETPAMRHEMVDRSEGGFRIRSVAPLLQGMSGTVLSILPEGKPVDQAVMVAWCSPCKDGGYEIGLRVF